MKLCNLKTESGTHLAALTDRGVVDLTAAGFSLTMDQLISGGDIALAAHAAADESLPVVEAPVFDTVVNHTGKLLCVGLNYKDHAKAIGASLPEYPVLFSKFADALAADNDAVTLPPWESTYDYEAELVIVMGKTCWGVSKEEAAGAIFGYTCGNDLSCRDSQMRSGQWLIGKTMPGFGPCGPYIVTADSFDPNEDHAVRSYVNGELKQDGTTTDMIFTCAEIVSYASKYICLQPGDLIFTGTPGGVALEGRGGVQNWLKPGDAVDIEIAGIGTLHNTMV